MEDVGPADVTSGGSGEHRVEIRVRIHETRLEASRVLVWDDAWRETNRWDPILIREMPGAEREEIEDDSGAARCEWNHQLVLLLSRGAPLAGLGGHAAEFHAAIVEHTAVCFVGHKDDRAAAQNAAGEQIERLDVATGAESNQQHRSRSRCRTIRCRAIRCPRRSHPTACGARGN